jgi:Domain of unknown function (DUF6438)
MKLLNLNNIIILTLSALSCNVVAELEGLIPEENVIVFERMPCYGNCPAYTVMVFETGLVVFNGEAHTNVQGVVTEQAPDDLFAKLHELLKDSNFNTFEDAYGLGKKCANILTDMPSSNILLQYEKKIKNTYYNHGCIGFDRQDELLELEVRIDNLIGTEKWVRINKVETSP